ncbi:BACON domain-containing carbohydrate-binding protein [Hoylesella buccalis]|uniref:BACON domain-containing protein n=1 Tax=Hoylesella buccalis TaxID=28127 RepID=UPI0026EFA29B|nr:BACON domain-containing carbohydrate-binding protein [Hoylesella buccalis]
MKLKYIIPSFIAVIAMFTGCADDNEPTYLDNLKVSSSYVAFDVKGGTQKITVTATEDWSMDFMVPVKADSLDDEKGIVKYNVPTSQMATKENSWIKVSQLSGGAGTTDISFTVGATTATRSVTVRIKAGDKYQNIIVAQIDDSPTPVSTVKDVLKGVDSKTYRVKGLCGKIINTSYGNWYMVDGEGNELYIYGTKDASGANNWKKFNIALGDSVTVEGARTTYKSTIEIKDATFISVKKALLLSKETNKTIGKESKPFNIIITQKGEGLNFKSNADWMTIEPGYTVNKKGDLVFTVNPSENTTGKNREGTLTFKSTKGKEESVLKVSIIQLGTTPVTTGGISGISSAISASSDKKKQVSFDVVLTDAKVTYKNGSNIFVEDATGGLLLYNGNSTLAVGDVINGRVWGAGYAFNGLPEATLLQTELAKVTKGDAPKPMEVTLAQLATDYGKYINRYIIIKDATVGKTIDVKYSGVKSAGELTDGTNTFVLNHQRTGKYKGKNIYYYVQAAKDSKVNVVCIPSVYKTKKQLNIWDKSWIRK